MSLSRPPPCGLPPFIDKLPADAQKKLQEIWNNYKQGEKCYNEHGLTRELVSSPNCKLSTYVSCGGSSLFFLQLESLPKDVRRAIFRHPPLPPPLMKEPKDVQDQFRAIFEDRSIPFEEKPKKMHELAQQVLKGDALKKFNEFHNKMEQHKKNMEELAQKLSPEAKQAYDKLSDLRKQKHQIMQSLSESARDELWDMWQARRDSFPRPR
ncbi:hypothetical protein Y032_0006g2837 [Ancylostoma ceylanicum]|uniref:SXP/RAL-2 family protein Ani s 5-like cation-binding domain-containing protein n=1 Tax=Ancylostoma ceylanicum TaxID=53326 RepID=A0A016VP60_9BILA|nr:hypothetical protein Y032_0006g2837 [Ancylostoma ceylanicum]